jgi:hypothetical protein
MKRLAFSKYLSAAFVAVAFAALGSAPTFAQTLSHYGSPLPRYYDAEGVQHWGSWAPPTAEQKVVSIPHHNLYLSAGQHPRNTRVR